ncbi:MAG TPA: bifunctional glutamate N-acetyltransferase/amino-acid acetyltransferase ArgJ [Kofleriaceae bacterium]|nr:bifunctional glutamate N-acetyltransferase/amino-acid acetyltransferase ArgJ [Kofleriaceae bacterium]
MHVPLGFTFAGVRAGLKPSRRDVALVASDVPAAAAGCFTTNLAAAAPVIDARPRVPADGIRAVVINSGNANALTGERGVADVRAIRAAIGDALGCAADAILAVSTGVIGVRLPAAKLVAAAPQLCAALTVAPEPAAEAILTTDTRTKLAARTLELGGRTVTISAIAKGSGMIAPQLATMIAIITTDAAIVPAMLDRALRAAIEPSFHCLIVDGDQSTNDSAIVLANGRAGNPPITDPGPALDAFTAALTALCIELARDIASDGEGSTRLVEVAVIGAPDGAIARDLARAIAGSPLVKAAMFGADPNWGRVLATVGARAGSQHYPIDPHKATVAIQGTPVFVAGEPALVDPPALRARLRAPEVRIAVDVAAGDAAATAWGCDLGYDYVKLNADYTSLIVQAPDGQLAKDDRLTNYSPKFKRTLLVEALSYISRFAGTRCVVAYGGAAMARPALEQAFCEDIELLRSVGLRPIVVHGGGPDAARTVERLGGDAGRAIELALGGVSAQLVTLLNLGGGHAIGISGKDAGLLRARRRDGGDTGEIAQVNAAVLELLLGQGYVPIVTPTALGDDGQSYVVDPDAAAAEIALALAAPKLIFLADVQGVLEHGELVGELTAAALDAKLAAGELEPSLRGKAQAILRASRGGVGRVHVIDGRSPHSVLAELFTDRGVGTLVTP